MSQARFFPAASACAVLAACLAFPAASHSAAHRTEVGGALHADFGRERPSRQASQVANWVLASGDNQGGSFVIVDKRQARVYVFASDGELRGAAPALLGLARGDDTVPGIGDKPLSQIKPQERTTPAGRFVAERGRNSHGKDVVWVDYDAAVSMHRVIAGTPAEHRARRLASRTIKDNRISYGCINLPVHFYEKVLSPAVAGGRTIIYVLPETRPASAFFGFATERGQAQAEPGRGDISLHRLDGA
jgi:hypothetical protein